MAKPKCSLETRLAVVHHYLSGNDGTERTAEQFGIERTSVRHWVRAYQYHCIDGITWKKEHYSAEFRIVVVQTVLNEKLSVREVAARFNISNETVIRRWVNVYKESVQEGLLRRERQESCSQYPQPSLLHAGKIKLAANGVMLSGSVEQQITLLRQAWPPYPSVDEYDELDEVGMWFLAKAPAGVVWLTPDGTETWT